MKWFRRATEQGDTAAQVDIGVMYDNGEGIPQNNADFKGRQRPHQLTLHLLNAVENFIPEAIFPDAVPYSPPG
jgi:TPR repeat protein